MKIYLNSEYKDRKKLEKAILEEFPEISVKSAKYKGGKKKATFVYKETCYKFDNRDDLLLTLKELLDYTERKEKLGKTAAAADEERILKEQSDKKSKNEKSNQKSQDEKSDQKSKEAKSEGKKEKGIKGKGKDKSAKGAKDEAELSRASQALSGKDVLVLSPKEMEEHVPTLKEMLKSKDYEQIDEAFYGETTFEEPEDQEDADHAQTGSYEASLPKSKEKDDDEVLSETFGDAEGLKAQTYEVEDIEETKESDIMKEMGFTPSESDSSDDRISYDESVPLSEGKGDLEIMEEAYDDLDKSKSGLPETQRSEDELEEGAIKPDELMRELGYTGSDSDVADGRKSYDESIPLSEGKGDLDIMEEAYDDLDKSKSGPPETQGSEEEMEESAIKPDELMIELGYLEVEEFKGQETEGVAHRKAGSVEDRSGKRIPLSRDQNEIVLEVPVEKYNLNDLKIKIKFGHFNEPSSTYETKKKP